MFNNTMKKPIENLNWVLVNGDTVYHFTNFKEANKHQLIIGGSLMPKFYFESNYKDIVLPKSEYKHYNL